MKITCSCGASIEIEYGSYSESIEYEKFKVSHAVCRKPAEALDLINLYELVIGHKLTNGQMLTMLKEERIMVPASLVKYAGEQTTGGDGFEQWWGSNKNKPDNWNWTTKDLVRSAWTAAQECLRNKKE